MIASLSLILLCQLAGEVIVRGLALPMPGPVVGLLLLLLLLLARDRFGVRARAAATGRCGECQPRPARASVAAVRPGWRRRHAEAGCRRRPWHRDRGGSRDLGGVDLAGDGCDVSRREPAVG